MGHRIAEEYRIIATGAGWLDRSSAGRLRFTGQDAASFLHALVTNDVAALEVARGVYATYLTPQGRMQADLTIYRRPFSLAAEVPPGHAASLAARFDQLVFAEDVQVVDETAVTCVLRVVGLTAASAGAEFVGAAEATLASLLPLAQVGTDTRFVARAPDNGVPAFDLWMPAAERDEALERLRAAGVPQLSAEFGESLRVAAARPAFDIDMSTDTIPLEAGLLDRAISLSKGCYVGQEVIVRVLHRGGGRVAKRLVLLEVGMNERAGLPPAGSPVRVAGHEAGRVTSSAWAPNGSDAIALAYLTREAATIGTAVAIEAPSGLVNAVVTKLAG